MDRKVLIESSIDCSDTDSCAAEQASWGKFLQNLSEKVIPQCSTFVRGLQECLKIIFFGD